MRLRHSLLALLLGSALGLVAPLAAAPPASAAARTCDGKRATIVGTSGPDTIRGTPRADVIVGLGGRDSIDGRGGDDRICGGGEKDRLAGGAGDDRVLGQGDGCFRSCARGAGVRVGNVLSGGPGDDALIGSDLRDPDDVVFANATRGVRVDLERGITIGQGRDRLRGIGNVETTRFDDVVRGLMGQGRAVLGGGDDFVSGTGERWTGFVSAGSGDDAATVSGGGSLVALGPGNDRATGTRRTTLNGGPGNDRLDLTGPLGGFLLGGSGADFLIGSGGNDEIVAGRGNDVVEARGGDDDLRGNGGDDELFGYGGRDRAHGGDGTDTCEAETVTACEG